MSEPARAFIAHLLRIQETDRGALAHLRRSLSFEPGQYPRAYPYVERFVGKDTYSDNSWRKALYLTAGLFALHPVQQSDVSFASAFGGMGHERNNKSIEQRFIALLDAGPDGLPFHLRQAISLLAADCRGVDYVALLEDLARWLNPLDGETHDRLRRRWARDFYRAFDSQAGVVAA